MVRFCRYYKGESECPHQNGEKAAFWECEKAWVDLSLIESDLLVENMNEYRSAGLLDFEDGDGVPVLLKALLYNRYVYWSYGTPNGFKDFYKEQYLS
jgi:hypothetical protein